MIYIYIYHTYMDPSWVIVITTLGPCRHCRPSFKVKFHGGSWAIGGWFPRHQPLLLATFNMDRLVLLQWIGGFLSHGGYPRMDGLISIGKSIYKWFFEWMINRDTPIFGNPSHHPIFVWHCPYEPSIFGYPHLKNPLILHKFSLSRKDLNDR